MAEVIRDEALVPPYTLPDPLLLTDGQRVTSRNTWQTQRCPELLELFREQCMGIRLSGRGLVGGGLGWIRW